MIKNLLAILAASILWIGAAFAQPGPSPAPNPWTINGNTISYGKGGVLVGTALTTQGVGTINISGNYYRNGAVISTVVNGVNCPIGGICTILAAAGSVQIGTTTISSGTNGRILRNNAGVLDEYTLTGTGTVVVMATSPTITTPSFAFVTGSNSNINGTSANTGFQNQLQVVNSGTVATSGTAAAINLNLSGTGNTTLTAIVAGGATPSAAIASGTNVTGGLTISANAGTLNLTSPNMTGTPKFTLGSDATGDMWYRNGSGNITRLGIGTNGQGLTVSGGGLPTWTTLTGTGTVTSVGLTVPAFLSVTGSPVTAAGTLAVSLANQNQNLVFAGPGTGAAAAPTFRALVNLDFPTGFVVAGTGLTGGNLAGGGTIAIDAASGSDYLAGTANKVVTAGVIYQSETTTTFGATTTFNFQTFINTVVTMTGNITTQTLQNVIAGKAGTIRFLQDATGNRTTVWNSIFKWAGGSAPTLTTTANASDLLNYNCISATFCQASLDKDVK